VLDSTPLYDAVATIDTITLIRSAVRGLLGVADADLAAALWAALSSGDDYASPGMPVIDWDDTAAREALVDSRARDGYALLAVLEDQPELPEPVAEAMRLLATVLGQDLETGPDGGLRIARKVACDRMISTVDPQARHGHRTSHRGFDGYKGHIALDPDAGLITATAVTPGNTGDAEPVAELITDLTDPPQAAEPAQTTTTTTAAAAVYGDAAYGAGEVLERLDGAGIDAKTKVQPPVAPAGKFPKDRFDINLEWQQVTCPNGTTVPIRAISGHARHAGQAAFGTACTACPLREECTSAKAGRTITIGHHEARLAGPSLRRPGDCAYGPTRRKLLAGRWSEAPTHVPASGRAQKDRRQPMSTSRTPLRRKVRYGVTTVLLGAAVLAVDTGVAVANDARSSTSTDLAALTRAHDTCLDRATVPVPADAMTRCVGDLATAPATVQEVDLWYRFRDCLYIAAQQSLDQLDPPTGKDYEAYVNQCMGL
jgi:hypothetical protein